jgi:hypothetical protein
MSVLSVRPLPTADLLHLVTMGCNAAEIAAYCGIPERHAADRIQAALAVRARMDSKAAAQRRWKAKRRENENLVDNPEVSRAT